MAQVLLRINTDLMSPTLACQEDPPSPFPSFDEAIANMAANDLPLPKHKFIEQTLRTPDRRASPQPSHISLPTMKNGNGNGNGNGQRVLRSATIGYTAPEFKGKKAQMALGESPSHLSEYSYRLIQYSEREDQQHFLGARKACRRTNSVVLQ